MGVLGLWEILESVGHPIKVEGIEGRVLGVDANIWLYKFIRGFREKDGASNIESHKLGLFNRISKLLFYRIKPVFVFDGPAPILKRRTLERRQNTRNKTLSKVQDAAMKALTNQLKSQYPDQDIDRLRIKLPDLQSNNLVAAEKLGDEDFNLFYLPPHTDTKKEDSDEYDSYSDDELEVIRDSTKVDVNSKDFKSMPPEIRYEILQDIKAKKRRICNVALPDDASSFSNLQLQRLKERREIQAKIERCEREICRNYTGELADGRSVQAFRVQSNKDLRILYCNNTYDPKALDSRNIMAQQTAESNSNHSQPSQQPEDETPSSQPGPSSQGSQLIPLEKEDSDEHDSYSDDEPEVIRVSTKVDVNLKDFKSLPPEIRYETSQEIKAKKRRIRNVALPDDASSFSNLQLQRERREMQAKIERCEREICRNYTGELADGRPVQAIRAQSNKDLKIPDGNNTYDPKALDSRNIMAQQTAESNSNHSQPSQQPEDETPSSQPGPSSQGSQLIPLEKEDSDEHDSYSDDEPEVIRVSTKVDVNSKDFKSMPPEIRYEILQDIKAKKRRIRNVALPDDASSFSNLQLQRERREMQAKIERCEREICRNYTGELADGRPVQAIRAQSNKDLKILDGNNTCDPKALDSRDIREQQTAESNSNHSQPSHQPEDEIPSSQGSQLISQSEHIANAQRATNRVTSKIIDEAKELLRLFGIPYIDAAGEAEAQCAKLEELKLTMGTITDDSDIWLFGAQNVFRYFFNDDKYVMQYKMPDIEYHIRMTRENLVCFAMLVGSDYTDGIMNVGPVTALEILSEFPGEGMESLSRFTDWQRAALNDKKLIGDKKRKKLLKYNIPSEFPSRAVYEGYMNPMADATEEKFTWGTPDLDELREYARRNFGWDQKKTDDKLLPVMKRLNEKVQKTIDTFFFKTQANRNPEMFRSKRVNQALNKIAKRAALDTDVVNLSEDDEDS